MLEYIYSLQFQLFVFKVNHSLGTQDPIMCALILYPL